MLVGVFVSVLVSVLISPPPSYKMINLLIYYLSTLVKEELATLEQICAVYVPEGVDHTAFSSIIRLLYNWVIIS